MWNFRNKLTSFITLLLVAGCTGEDVVTPPASGQDLGAAVTVSFRVSDNGEAAMPIGTRAAEGTSPLAPGETVRMLVYLKGATDDKSLVGENTYFVKEDNTLAPCTVGTDGVMTGEGKDLFLLPGREYDFYAHSPALPRTSGHPQVQGIAHGADFVASMTPWKLEKFTKAIELVPLKHQCAKVEFEVCSDPDDFSVNELSGQRITLKKMARPTATYTLNPTPGVAPAAVNDAEVKIESFEKHSETGFSAQQVVLPKSNEEFELVFEVLINGSPYTLKALVNSQSLVDLRALEGGKHYKWKVTCKRTGVNLVFSVANWNETKSSSVVGIPAPLQQPGNSYLVAPGMGISFDMLLPDGQTPIPNATDIVQAELLWQTKDNGELLVTDPSHVIWDSTNKRIRVYTNSAAQDGGKAMIVARKQGGVEVYRWMVWVTPYQPQAALTGNKKTNNTALTVTDGSLHTYDSNFFAANGVQTLMMDRDLGAQKVGAPGCSYQQGSYEPFAAGSNGQAEPLFTADGSSYTLPELPTTAPATEWTPVAINGNDARGNKSNSDPCPYGWRVPAKGTWHAFNTLTFTTLLGDVRQYIANSVNAQYPTGCWAANSAVSNGYALTFDNSTVTPDATLARATRLAVRCVQDATRFPVGTPTLEPVSITNITATDATLNGHISAYAEATIEEYGFYYIDTKPSGNQAGTKVTASNLSADKFAQGITSLKAGVTYYVQAYVVTTGGIAVYTPYREFIPAGLPGVTTGIATSTGATTGTVAANVYNTGGDDAATRGVVYSQTLGFDPSKQGTSVAATGMGQGDYTVDLTGLQAGTTYYVYAYVTNKIATTYGLQRSFTTLAVPMLATPNVTNLRCFSATFTAKLNGPLPKPGVTKWGFEYSTNANFPEGNTTVDVPAEGSYELGSSFTAGGANLLHTTPYYVRAYAVNEAGKGYSFPVRFITPTPPTVTTLPIGGGTLIGTNAKVIATLNGKVERAGTSSVTGRWFEYSKTDGFEGGTGTIVSDGSGGLGAYAVVYNQMDYNTTYYIRACAANSGGIGYGEIVKVRLDYVPPTFGEVTVSITDRMLRALPSVVKGTPHTGNAVVIAQGKAYQEEGTSNYIRVGVDETPRLKVYKKYIVKAYVRNGVGTYYSEAEAEGMTYKNYFTYGGREYVVDEQAGEGYEPWVTGISSLVFVGHHGDSDDGGLFLNRWLEASDQWGFRPHAAMHCMNKPAVDGHRWFLGYAGPLAQILTELKEDAYNRGGDDKIYIYDPKIRDVGGSYWTATEHNSMTMIKLIHNWELNGAGWFQHTATGKNYKSSVRCIRYRSWSDRQ